jgi:hypothetical protein
MCNLDIINHLEQEGNVHNDDDDRQARVLIDHIVAAIEGMVLSYAPSLDLIVLCRLFPIHCSTTRKYVAGLPPSLDALVQVWWCRSSQWDRARRTGHRTRGYVAASNSAGALQRSGIRPTDC